MRRLFVFLIVLVLLLVAADRIALFVAERGLATAIQNSQHLAQRPDVQVDGFPFLTQVIRGRYQHVDADIRGLAAEKGLTIDTLHVQLRGVQVSTSDLINGQVSKAPVDSASAVATVSYASLDSAAKANIPDNRLSVHFKQGQGKLLAITGSYDRPQIKLRLNAQAQVRTSDGDLAIGLTPSSIADLPAPVRAQVTSLLGGAYKLPPLPFGFKARTVTVGPAGVTVRATATSVELTNG